MSEAAAAPVAAPATSAAPQVAPAATDAMVNGLDAVLGDLSEGLEGGRDDAGQLEPGAEPAETEVVDPKARQAPDDLIFSDEQLATPEGVKRGKARVAELRKLQHQKYMELKGYERHVAGKAEKFKTKLDAFRSEKQSHELLLNNVRSNLQGLHSNDPETILTALGNLTGTDGYKAYELLTQRIVNRGDQQVPAHIQAVLDEQKREIEQLKGSVTSRQQVEEVKQLNSQISQHHRALGERIAASAQRIPHLARIYADDPQGTVEFVAEQITEAFESGNRLDADAYFGNLEAQLAKHFGASQAPPQGNGGGTAPKQPSTAQSSPGRSVGPSMAAAATQRAPSEEEIFRQLANDTELLASLGL